MKNLFPDARSIQSLNKINTDKCGSLNVIGLLFRLFSIQSDYLSISMYSEDIIGHVACS